MYMLPGVSFQPWPSLCTDVNTVIDVTLGFSQGVSDSAGRGKNEIRSPHISSGHPQA